MNEARDTYDRIFNPAQAGTDCTEQLEAGVVLPTMRDRMSRVSSSPELKLTCRTVLFMRTSIAQLARRAR